MAAQSPALLLRRPPACPLGPAAPRLSQSWLLAEGTVMGVCTLGSLVGEEA